MQKGKIKCNDGKWREHRGQKEERRTGSRERLEGIFSGENRQSTYKKTCRKEKTETLKHQRHHNRFKEGAERIHKKCWFTTKRTQRIPY